MIPWSCQETITPHLLIPYELASSSLWCGVLKVVKCSHVQNWLRTDTTGWKGTWLVSRDMAARIDAALPMECTGSFKALRKHVKNAKGLGAETTASLLLQLASPSQREKVERLFGFQSTHTCISSPIQCRNGAEVKNCNRSIAILKVRALSSAEHLNGQC
jgi:hypothetical protein